MKALRPLSLQPVVFLCLLFVSLGCTKTRLISRFVQESLRGGDPVPAPAKPEKVVRDDARLVATWVGHATVLIQIDDKFVLTDPVFAKTIGLVVERYVEPGLRVEELPPIDAALISHMHFDHLSLRSLDLLDGKLKQVVVPKGGLAYVPGQKPLPIELDSWESMEIDGLRITATPVDHVGWRYGADKAWRATAFTGYVVEYAGLSVYFGGDTAASPWMFHATGRRFPGLDLALLPIAPIHPREYMCRTHMNPDEALDAFADLGARWMMPIHFDTFFNSLDEFGEAPARLRWGIQERNLDPSRFAILQHGQQHVFVP